MGNGSRWYYQHWEGLIDAKHVQQMGTAIWLYEFLLSRAWVAQRDGIVTYSHVEAAQVLGRTERTIKTWFAKLQEQGYIINRARHSHHLEVQITKWRPLEKFRDARQVDDVRFSSLHKQRSEASSEERSEGSFIPLLTKKLRSYPKGEACASLADLYHTLLAELKITGNRPAVLRDIYSLCFGEIDVPDYGYLGRAAKRVGGAGRLAQLMWELTSRPPTGDILAYIQAAEKARKRRNGNGQKPGGLVAALAEWEEDHTNGQP